jgi:hypothetical protein
MQIHQVDRPGTHSTLVQCWILIMNGAGALSLVVIQEHVYGVMCCLVCLAVVRSPSRDARIGFVCAVCKSLFL